MHGAWIWAFVVVGCAASTTQQSDTDVVHHDASSDCLAQLIAQAESASIGNPPRSFSTCTYRGHTAYYAPPQCCDQYSALIDPATCQAICAPDGGFTGAGDGRCPDFDSSSCTVAWTDPRTP